MKITWLDRLAQFHNLLQCELFPLLESAVGPLDKQSKLLAAVVSLEPLARFVSARRAHTGRPLSDRLALATAFFAKAVYSLPTTRHLIQRLQTDTPLRRLCGWDSAAQVPTEATFSRAFAEFAASELPAKIHEELVRHSQQGRVIGYIARDSTAIEAREHLPGDKDKAKSVPAPAEVPKPARKRGAKKGRHKRSQARQRGTRLQRQGAHDAGADARRTAAAVQLRREEKQQRIPAILARLQASLGRSRRRPHPHQLPSHRRQRPRLAGSDSSDAPERRARELVL
jgi:hypothetical protein